MNTKTVEEQNITDEELELIQNTDPASDPMDAATTGSDSRPESSEPGVVPSAISLQEIERLKAERDQLFDRLARMQAEFDNARKREARERKEFRDFAAPARSSSFCRLWIIFSLR